MPSAAVADRPTLEQGEVVLREAYEVVIQMLENAERDAKEPPELTHRLLHLARIRSSFDGLLLSFPNPSELLRLVGCESDPDGRALNRSVASDRKVERLADLLEAFLHVHQALVATLGDDELVDQAIRSEAVRTQVQRLDIEAGIALGLGAVC